MKLRSAALGLSLAMVCGVSASSAWAGSPAAETVSAGEALNDDLAAFARERGITADQAATLTDGQDRFAELVTQFKEENPGAFVAAAWDGADSAQTRVLVKKGVPVKGNLPGIQVVAVDALSAQEVEKIVSRTMAVFDGTMGLNSLSVDVDPLTRQVKIFYSGSVSDADLSEKVAQVTSSGSSGAGAKVVLVKEAVGSVTLENS